MIKKIKENIEKVMIGQSKTIDLLLVAILSEGHILIEDMPGTGKTVLATSLAKSISSKFSRIQFTPDLLPSDVTGLSYFDQKSGEFIFKEGPAFCNILLADEINRASPRTQSSLLECMAEKQITVDGNTRLLKKPFLVIATQNPLENLGTYPLPEAQLDRFLMRISMISSTKEDEIKILKRFLTNEPLKILESVCTSDDIIKMINEAQNVFIHEIILEYIANIAHTSRKSSEIEVGISPRASIALCRAVRAYAFIKNRNFVTIDDIKDIAPNILAHRLQLLGGFSTVENQENAIKNLLNSVPAPTEDFNV